MELCLQEAASMYNLWTACQESEGSLMRMISICVVYISKVSSINSQHVISLNNIDIEGNRKWSDRVFPDVLAHFSQLNWDGVTKYNVRLMIVSSNPS